MRSEKLTPEERKRIGSLGGKARARRLSREMRVVIARKAAQKRWGWEPQGGDQQAA
jgi:hypothetical protein